MKGRDRNFQKIRTGYAIVWGKEAERVNRMIEIIYGESGKNNGAVIIKPPKNIRQIGNPRGRHKIYMEDYVYTFLHGTVFEGEKQKRAAVLLGKSEVAQDIRYTFISGAVLCEDFVFQEEGILFDESCWEYIYKEIKQYFDNLDIVGWFLGMAGFPIELTPAVEAAHRKYFAGRDKVLFLSEPSEGEDTFFAYEQGILQKKEGYYVYYEKNLPMQEYMVCTKEQAREQRGGIETHIYPTTLETPGSPAYDSPPAVEAPGSPAHTYPSAIETPDSLVAGVSEEEAPPQSVSEQSQTTESRKAQPEEVFWQREGTEKISAEQAIQNYRSMLQGKKAALPQKRMNLLLYTAASAAMVVLCVIGITAINNYEKMQQVEQVLSVMSKESDIPEKKDGKTEELVVQSIPGEVTPKEDASVEEEEKGQEDKKKEGETTQEGEGNEGETIPEGGEGEAEPAGDDPEEGPVEPERDGSKEESGNSGEMQEDPSQNNNGEAQEGDATEQSGEDSAQEPQSQETLAQTYLAQGYYVVQPGDKLEVICKMIYNTAAMLEKLCEANQIEDMDKIYAGQKLVLP